MNYWVVKGNQRSGRNDFNSMLKPGATWVWQTRKRPRLLADGDRVFLWESSPAKSLLALADVHKADSGEKNGDQFFELRYLTGPLIERPTLTELRLIQGLEEASFLKSGPAQTVLALASAEAKVLFEHASRTNPDLIAIWPDLLPDKLPLPADIELVSGLEGKELLVLHIRRERDHGLVETKKNEVLSKTQDLKCEVCAFSFHARYGARGRAFCEVHHRSPLAVGGPRKTVLDDLAVVCSNCHRMLHREPWTTISELRKELDITT